MRKYLIGTLFGFVLATAAGANAQEVNKLVDSVVQGVFPVTVEGSSVGEAIVVNDKTYLPVKEFGEAVGYNVAFNEDSREVVLSKKLAIPVPSKSIGEQIDSLKKKISDINSAVETNKGVLKSNVAFAERFNMSKEDLQKVVDTINASIATAEAQIADYQAQIVLLEAQK